MRGRDTVRLAVSQLREARVFFWANVIAIAVGVLLIVVMLSIALGLSRYVDAMLQKEASADMIEVTSEARVAAAPPPLTVARIRGLAAIANVRLATPVVQGIFADLLIPRGGEVFVSAASTSGSTDPELVRLTFLAGAPAVMHANSVVLPETVVRQLGLFDVPRSIGRNVILHVTRAGLRGEESADVPLLISAVARQTRFSRCYLSLPLAQSIASWQENPNLLAHTLFTHAYDTSFVYDTVIVYARSVADVPVIRKTIEAHGYQTASILDSIHRYRQIMFVATIVLTSLGAVALFTGAISIFNAAYASVMRRLREFAIYKTYGATRGAIMRLVVTEAVITAVCAGIIGFAAAAVICLGLQRLVSGEVDALLFPIVWWHALVAEATAIIACVAASIGPARIAARLTPVEALRVG